MTILRLRLRLEAIIAQKDALAKSRNTRVSALAEGRTGSRGGRI
jgi:hypothetical protein